MKTKIVCVLLAGSLLALTAWLVHGPSEAQADAVPEKYRDTVRKGLEYLVKHQAKDGHWEGDDGKHPVAITGLVGLALLMDAENPGGRRANRTSKYSAEIRKATDWLIEQSQAKRDGLIFSGHASETSRYMQGHGLATLFLAAACESDSNVARRKRVTDTIIRAVRYIEKAQSTGGGWYRTSRVEGHDFAEIWPTVIQIQALQAVEHAGIIGTFEAIDHGQQYVTAAIEKRAKAKGDQNRARMSELAAGLACRLGPVSLKMKDDLSEKWFKVCQAEIPVGAAIQLGRDELTHYYFAQAIFLRDHDKEAGAWKEYRTAMFDHLQRSQNKDGSWPSGDGLGVGPVYSTAVWCTILQLDNQSHPLMWREMDVK